MIFQINSVLLPKIITMEKKLFQNTYRVDSWRAQWHTYDAGVYFVTICTHNHVHVFGHIEDNIMYYSEMGDYAVRQIEMITSHYPYAEVPLYIVMPNHIHLLISIDSQLIPFEKRRVETPDTLSPPMKQVSRQTGWLSVVVRGLKMAITKYARDKQIEFQWQKRFHEHIVRNIRDLNAISDYIETNVARWESDLYY